MSLFGIALLLLGLGEIAAALLFLQIWWTWRRFCAEYVLELDSDLDGVK